MTDSRFHTLLAVSLLGFLVWKYGPLLHIGQSAPFESISNRLITLLALTIIWGLTNLRSELHLFKSTPVFNIDNRIKIISRKLMEIQRQIKLDQKKAYNQQPPIHWHLVIGPCGSGKTNLLNSAFDTDQDRNLVTVTQDCAIWYNHDNVFVELGEHFMPNRDDPEACQLLFQAFLKLCDRLGIQFHNIVVALSINQVMTNTVDADISRTHQMLNTLIAQHPGLPISIIFTKCDQIAGFTAFFCDLPMDEREQYCGIRLPFGLNAANLRKTIHTHLQQLNRRFHDRLLTRLQQETHLLQRNAMHDFPYQFELFCSKVIHFLNELVPDCDINLTGLFLTSSQQIGVSTNHLTSYLSEVISLQPSPHADRYSHQTPYFISELCQHLLPSFAESATHIIRPRHKINPMLIPTIAISILGLGIYHLYSAESQRIQLANLMVKNTQLQNNESMMLLAQQLGNLNDAIKLLEQNSTKLGKVIRPGHPQELIKQTQQQINHILTHQFANALDNTLQQKLRALSQNSEQNQLADLYDALKITLLLKQPELATVHQRSLISSSTNKEAKQSPQEILNQQVTHWFNTEWQNTISDKNTRETLFNALKTALKNPQFSIQSDANLISHARQVLTSSSPDNIIYTILENENRSAPIIISDSSITNTPIKIAGIYTRAAYKQVVNEEIPTLCEKFAEGNWVLSNNPSQMISIGSSAHLAQALKTRYLNAYVNAWKNAITQLHYTPLQRYSHLISALNNLSNMQSPFIDFLQMVQINTANIENENDFNEVVSENFSNLNDTALEDPHDPLHTVLQNYVKYLMPLAQPNTATELAFNITKERISKPSQKDDFDDLYEIAKSSPEPIKGYLKALADNGWNLLIADTRQYINNVWSTIVVPEYQQHLHNRYPLYTKANAELSLDDFARFFAPKGTMDTFFKEYVEAFISDSEDGWQWKTINGQKLALSDDALAAFIRANLIQKMFFNEGQHHPNAHFTLTPTQLNNDLKNFTIILNGQRVEYHGPNQAPEHISWPGPQQTGVFIEVADNSDQKNQVGYPGLWGIFHLMDKAQVENTSNPSNIDLNWLVNDKRIDCQITSDAPINPFTPGIINQFRCPNSLL
jgi:type VI secretion system protein ImpL